jgi:hypothetical protein
MRASPRAKPPRRGVSAERSEAGPPSRWELLRDVLVFQLKLGLDATRDVVLAPLSLAAAVLDLLTGEADGAGRRFYQVLLLGRRSERWIGLFGAADRVEPESGEASARGVDAAVARVEARLVEQYARGGVTAQAKDAIDRALDGVTVRRRSRKDEPPD